MDNHTDRHCVRSVLIPNRLQWPALLQITKKMDGYITAIERVFTCIHATRYEPLHDILRSCHVELRTVLTIVRTGREGSHGYLPQILLRSSTRRLPFRTIHSEL